MGIAKHALVVMLGISGASAYASCPQDSMRLGRIIGQTFCTATKDAFANDVVIWPRATYTIRQNRCEDGSSFDFRDVLYCKQAVANSVSSDRFCHRIMSRNDHLSYGGSFGEASPRFVYQSFQRDCSL